MLQHNFEGLEDDKRIEGKGTKTIMFIFSDFFQVFAFSCKQILDFVYYIWPSNAFIQYQ